MKISNFLAFDGKGNEIAADSHGNNVAFNCFSCGHPVLAIAREHQRGSSEECPAACKNCGTNHFLDVREAANKFHVLTV